MPALKQPPSAQSIEQIRTRARRRLIGSIILVILAVAILPWIFDSQPRESVVDIPIEIVGRPTEMASEPVVVQPPVIAQVAQPQEPAMNIPQADQNGQAVGQGGPAGGDDTYVSPFVDPAVDPHAPTVDNPAGTDVATVSSTGQPTESANALHSEATGGSDLALSGGYAVRPANMPTIPSKYSPSRPPSTQVASSSASTSAARAAAALLGENPDTIVRTPQTQPRTTPSTTTASPRQSESSRRFVVQVGSYADANKANEVRARLTMAGYSSFTQEVQTEAGRRIRVRVGPYDGRVAADAVADKIRAMGLDAFVSPA